MKVGSRVVNYDGQRGTVIGYHRLYSPAGRTVLVLFDKWAYGHDGYNATIGSIELPEKLKKSCWYCFPNELRVI